MQQIGYKILNDIAWEKPNPPPNLSCRYFTHSTETVIWAAKNDKSRHYFDYALMKRDNRGKQMKTVWQIAPPQSSEKDFGKHPTQKPLSLLERCISSSTKVEDFVLDPFMGSGTTGVACSRLGRRFVGIELDTNYIDISVKRINSEEAANRRLFGIETIEPS
jgi:site-specific DNA-methyltransferase (adenine-specific)